MDANRFRMFPLVRQVPATHPQVKKAVSPTVPSERCSICGCVPWRGWRCSTLVSCRFHCLGVYHQQIAASVKENCWHSIMLHSTTNLLRKCLYFFWLRQQNPVYKGGLSSHCLRLVQNHWARAGGGRESQHFSHVTVENVFKGNCHLKSHNSKNECWIVCVRADFDQEVQTGKW